MRRHAQHSSLTDKRVAYLATHYPALSHVFIEREVRGVRKKGIDVRTFSIRPTTGQDLLGTQNAAAAATTICLFKTPKRRWLWAHLSTFLRSPGRYVRTLFDALSTGRSLKERVWQMFYFAEAGLLRSEAHRLGVEHLHVHHANNVAEVARLACRLSGDGDRAWTWSLTMHGSAEFWNVEAFHLARKVESANLVACISEFTRAQLMALVHEDHWSKLHVVHMGVDLDRYKPYGEMRSGRSSDLAYRILFVARLIEAKGISLLLDAVRQLQGEGTPVELHLVGDGPMRLQIEDYIRRHSLAGVTLCGALGQDDLIREYEWADVFCLPSFAEGVPVVLMEAMATELPVVATRIAGIPELVTDGEVGGILVTPGRSDALLAAFQSLKSDRQRGALLGRSGRVRVQEAFDSESEAVKLADLWRKHWSAGAAPSRDLS